MENVGISMVKLGNWPEYTHFYCGISDLRWDSRWKYGTMMENTGGISFRKTMKNKDIIMSICKSIGFKHGFKIGLIYSLMMGHFGIMWEKRFDIRSNFGS